MILSTKTTDDNGNVLFDTIRTKLLERLPPQIDIDAEMIREDYEEFLQAYETMKQEQEAFDGVFAWIEKQYAKLLVDHGIDVRWTMDDGIGTLMW